MEGIINIEEALEYPFATTVKCLCQSSKAELKHRSKGCSVAN